MKSRKGSGENAAEKSNDFRMMGPRTERKIFSRKKLYNARGKAYNKHILFVQNRTEGGFLNV